ncbi:hypothetical protein POV26_07130 [Aequorivita todarodis]|uniref:hypothetical protein n=1 Tax=Aequorivita todarodis TaxID=2036821 RepID=UPI002350CD1B|nr:hypothetical protein [Aequorivita todarodis]MDC8000804.1 hypothetical protein [Aequorivita todarodis]
MKTNVFYTGIVGMVLALFTFTACNKEETANEPTVSQSEMVNASKDATEADNATDGAFSLIETAYSEIEENEGRNASLFPDCTTITITSENGVTFVTLDFGLGCELPNGNIVSGKIHLTYGPKQNGTRTITYQFENFVFNDKGIAGGGTIFRERNNANGNPQATIHLNLHVLFPSGALADVSGTKVREWIEGMGSGTWMDNVFLVTGNRTINFSTGFESYAIVTEALRREATCRYFVSGVLDITRNGHNGTLDFGDGTCDNLAILTIDGVEYEIILH